MPDENHRPDIVLLMVDQLAAKWLEAAQSGVVDLPHFEELRRRGVTFSNAFSTNPVCSPARASIATGLTCSGHGITDCGYTLDPQIRTFMHALQDGGWRTGAFGKMHFIPQMAGVRPDYRPYGFDVTRITEDARAGEWLDWVGEHHPQHYRAAQATVWMTMVPELRRYGPDHHDLAADIEAIRATHTWASPEFPDGNAWAYTLPFPAEVSQTHWITDRARDFVRETPADTPLFAHISYVQPHSPFAPPAEYVERVRADRIPAPVAAEWDEDQPQAYFRQGRYNRLSYEDGSDNWRQERLLYFADLAHLDAELGRLLDCLRETGRLDNTYLLFTSDHGELLHDHGMVGKWERHYDSCIRIPMSLAGPGIPGGVTRAGLVDHTDIAPTIYEITGLEPPRLPRPHYGRPHHPQEIPPLPGRSLLPSALGAETPGCRDAVYIQSNNTNWDTSPGSWARTIRTGRYRYTRFFNGGGAQLFDLETDPDEQHNLAGDPRHSLLEAGLKDQLFELAVLDSYPPSPRDLYAVGTW